MSDRIFLTVSEYAAKHEVTPARIHQLIGQGRIGPPHLKRLGRQYAIPSDLPYPEDRPIGRPKEKGMDNEGKTD